MGNTSAGYVMYAGSDRIPQRQAKPALTIQLQGLYYLHRQKSGHHSNQGAVAALTVSETKAAVQEELQN